MQTDTQRKMNSRSQSFRRGLTVEPVEVSGQGWGVGRAAKRKINCDQHLVITGKVITRADSTPGATYPPNSSVPGSFLPTVQLTLVKGWRLGGRRCGMWVECRTNLRGTRIVRFGKKNCQHRETGTWFRQKEDSLGWNLLRDTRGSAGTAVSGIGLAIKKEPLLLRRVFRCLIFSVPLAPLPHCAETSVCELFGRGWELSVQYGSD